MRIANGSAVTSEEVFSGIELLVAVAQADGLLHPAERLAVHNALEGAAMFGGVSAAALLATKIDVDLELSRIHSDEARQRTLAAAWSMVHVDGEVSPAEDALLTRIAAGLGFSVAARAQSVEADRPTTPPPLATRADNTRHREVASRAEVANASAFSAALAIARLPGSASDATAANNVRLARNIGIIYGHDVDDTFWRTFTQNLIGTAAPWFAISSLLQLLPGAQNQSLEEAYATTYALGQVTRLYVQSEVPCDLDSLRTTFRELKQDGVEAARRATTDIAMHATRLERVLLETAYTHDLRESA